LPDTQRGSHEPVSTEEVPGSDSPVRYLLAETMDGLDAPYALRVPPGLGPHPFVLVAHGNGGGGLPWLRDRVRRFGHVTDRLLDAGYACAWTRCGGRRSTSSSTSSTATGTESSTGSSRRSQAGRAWTTVRSPPTTGPVAEAGPTGQRGGKP
jgi:hypothetical protein